MEQRPTDLGLPVIHTAGAQEGRPDYLKLQREHEQLKREMQELRTLVQGAGQKTVPAATPAEGQAATGEPTKADDALTLGRYVFPGSTKFLLTGYGSAGFQALRHSDARMSSCCTCACERVWPPMTPV